MLWQGNWKILLHVCVCGLCVCVCMGACVSLQEVVHCCHRTHLYFYRIQLHPSISPQGGHHKSFALQPQENARIPVFKKGALFYLYHAFHRRRCTDKHLAGSLQVFEVLPLTRSCHIAPDQHDTANNTMTRNRQLLKVCSPHPGAPPAFPSVCCCLQTNHPETA